MSKFGARLVRRRRSPNRFASTHGALARCSAWTPTLAENPDGMAAGLDDQRRRWRAQRNQARAYSAGCTASRSMNVSAASARRSSREHRAPSSCAASAPLCKPSLPVHAESCAVREIPVTCFPRNSHAIVDDAHAHTKTAQAARLLCAGLRSLSALPRFIARILGVCARDSQSAHLVLIIDVDRRTSLNSRRKRHAVTYRRRRSQQSAGCPPPDRPATVSVTAAQLCVSLLQSPPCP